MILVFNIDPCLIILEHAVERVFPLLITKYNTTYTHTTVAKTRSLLAITHSA